MHDNLKTKITEYLEDQDTSIQAFERKANLSRNAVYSILTDKSKNPNIETVLKIADALNCSLDELYERKHFLKKHADEQLFKITLNCPLFTSVCDFIIDYLHKNNCQDLNLGQTIDAIQEIYKYCLAQNSLSVDKHFANWFLNNNF